MQTSQAEASSDYPRKPVRLIVPSAPGGGIDIIARLLAPKVGGAWGQSIVVDNRAGGGTTIGTNTVAKAAPDGYTILLTSIAVAYIPALYVKLPYNTEKELDPVTLIVTQPNLLVVHPNVPAKSVAELIVLANSRPGEILYGSGGSGTAPHLATELLRTIARINLVHVPYKGGGPAVTALMAGEVHMLIAGMATLLPHVGSGRMRALAVTGTTRAKAVPELPTIAEAGLPGAEFDTWYGLMVPARTPNGVIRKINETFNRVLTAQDVQERLAGAGMEPLGGTQEKFAAYLKAEIKKWAVVVREAKIQVN
ncbi:MAG: tripartite tricarboxylate transporter substrate binding protein [Betaproteobacteria bacterium]|nr:tripartite tricarboxylate transporter substrate binding protein [Betaproteobacteria bacterium]